MANDWAYLGRPEGLTITSGQGPDGINAWVKVEQKVSGYSAKGDSHGSYVENLQEAQDKLGAFLRQYYEIQRQAPGKHRLDLTEGIQQESGK